MSGQKVGSSGWGVGGVGVGVGAVDAEDGGAVVGEEEAGEGASGGISIWRVGMGKLGVFRCGVPGARPANSSTRMPVSGGGELMLVIF